MLALLWSEAVVTIFVGARQSVNQFSGIEVIVDDFLVGFHCQQATYVLHHLIGIHVQLQHLISGIQVVTFGSHAGDLPVWLGVVGVIGAECITRIVDHILEFRIGAHFLARLFQIAVQEAIDAGVCLRNVVQENICFGGDELRYVIGYSEAVSFAPREFFAFFAHRTYAPVPCAAFQHLVRVEYAPGFGL